MLTMGIDIGSTTCKGIILENGKSIVSRALVSLGTGTVGPRLVLEQTLAGAGVVRSDIARSLVTGYGRLSFAETDSQMTELNCHAAGVHFLLPSARTVVDIGGQDVKVLRINERGTLENFVMNDKCAAGTGRFLDVMARIMNLKTEELGPLSKQAQQVISISNTCTVFAESEVISKLSSNMHLPDLVAGIHDSVARRVAGLVFRLGVIKDVAMSGGVALNEGVVGALSRELKTDILVHEDCQLMGALGAAVYAHRQLVQR